MTRRWGVPAAALVWVLGSASAVCAQEPAPGQGPRFESGAEAVALDLVVRDKKGRLVTDLRPEEIEVLEDGVPQKLTSFRITAPAAAAPAAAAAAAAANAVPPSGAAPATTTADSPRRFVLAFSKLTSDGRRLAQLAGDEFARKHASPRPW